MDNNSLKNLINNLGLTSEYATNKNWLGFFERKTKFTESLVTEALAFFTNFFKDDMNDFIIANSYYLIQIAYIKN